jgi:hypothetical protein
MSERYKGSVRDENGGMESECDKQTEKEYLMRREE